MPRVNPKGEGVKLLLLAPRTPQYCTDASILVQDYESARFWLATQFGTYQKYNICYRKARRHLLEPNLYPSDVHGKMHTQDKSGKWENVFPRVEERTDSLESTMHAFKDTVAFIINITVVIPSDE